MTNRLDGIVPGLEAALTALADTHTRDDDLAGFVVEMQPSNHRAPWVSESSYIEAWEKVRMALNRNVNPSPGAAE